MTTTAAHVALLAPVPLEHLVSGWAVARSEGKVAFGTRAWKVFRDLDELRERMPVDAYLYASQTTQSRALEVSWQAVYVGQIESIGGAHPDGMRYRPSSTAKYANDSVGKWAVFWEVRDLREITPKKRLALACLSGFGKKRAYGPAFWPEGPLLIEHP